MTTDARRIIFCKCSNSDVVPADVKKRVLKALTASTEDVVVLSDLCGSAALSKDDLLNAVSARELVFIACFPRAVKWMLATAGVSIESKNVEFFNMRQQSADEILQILELSGFNSSSAASDAHDKYSDQHSFARPDEKNALHSKNNAIEERQNALREADNASSHNWIPWFPVIDHDLCIDCRQCMDFCLFGVFDLDENGKVRVVKPANCKDNCPACARICPKAAIMFPKFSDSPINGGEVDSVEKDDAKVKVDVNELLGDDLYATLKRRKRSRKKLFKEQKEQRGGDF